MWLRGGNMTAVFHLRRGNSADLARLARILTGNAVGLVLGGGGARGFAHLGVLRALEELNVPIDMVGGTSMGAPIAGFDAQDKAARIGYDAVIEPLREIAANLRSARGD